MQEQKALSLSKIIGEGYRRFWNFKGRYRVVKGSRASKKSTTAALNLIYRIMTTPQANALVVRQTAATLKDSCFAQLRWAIERLGVADKWKYRVSPLELEYKDTEQRILFKGLDDAFKTTSVTVPKGVLCWLWVEEAYEIDESDFNTLDESLRGEMPDGCFVQTTLTFNPWDANCFLKRRFFDIDSPEVLAITTTYHCNEFLSDTDLKMYELMKLTDPERYKVAGLGEWGLANGQFFDVWNADVHICEPFDIPEHWIKFRAADWGSAAPYCVLWFAVDYDGNLWCYRELYGWGGKPNVGTKETAQQVAEKICQVETQKENVQYGVLDSACWSNLGVTGPTIAEEMNNILEEKKLVTFGKCSKGRAEGANQLRQRLIGSYDGEIGQVPAIRFFNTCKHLIRTLPMLSHDKHNPETYDTDGEDHAVDAAVYACMSRPWTPEHTRITNAIKRDDYRSRSTERKPSVWTK